MKPIDVFRRLFEKVITHSPLLSGSRKNYKKGIPGEYISQLSDEERKVLANLKPEDLEKVPKEDVYYVADMYQFLNGLDDKKYAEQLLKEEMLKFDKSILKHKFLIIGQDKIKI